MSGYGPFADIQRHSQLRPLSGVKRTPKVRFQGPATNPAGAEDVTNMLGKRHGYVGHGFVGGLVVFGVSVAGFGRLGSALWFAPLCPQERTQSAMALDVRKWPVAGHRLSSLPAQPPPYTPPDQAAAP